MSCSRQTADIWWYLFKHPNWLRDEWKNIIDSPYFWHDSFGKYWNRAIGCGKKVKDYLAKGRIKNPK